MVDHAMMVWVHILAPVHLDGQEPIVQQVCLDCWIQLLSPLPGHTGRSVVSHLQFFLILFMTMEKDRPAHSPTAVGRLQPRSATLQPERELVGREVRTRTSCIHESRFESQGLKRLLNRGWEQRGSLQILPNTPWSRGRTRGLTLVVGNTPGRAPACRRWSSEMGVML